MKMRFPCRRVLLLSVMLLLFGCASYAPAPNPDRVTFYFSPQKIENEQELSRIRSTVVAINEKNKAAKKSPERLREFYDGIKIRKLDSISPDEYATFARFVDPAERRAYVIVHPAYYAFFMNDSVLASAKDLLPQENIVEKFCARTSYNNRELKIMQEQERVLRDFLQTAVAEKKLVILVLPTDYKSHLSYGYVQGNDEYARYLNEITEAAESVVYVESLEFSTGYIGEADLNAISGLLKSAGVEKIMMGGEFAGRCLDNAYYSLHRKFDSGNIYIVPELTAVSGKDVSGISSQLLFTKDGMLNFREISKSLRYVKKYDPADVNIQHFYIYDAHAEKPEPVN